MNGNRRETSRAVLGLDGLAAGHGWVQITRDLHRSSTLTSWLHARRPGLQSPEITLTIDELGASGQTIRSWDLFGARTVSWEGPSLDASEKVTVHFLNWA